MKSRPLVEALSALAVIASLLFVGMEIRQNTRAVRGATYQALADASVQSVQWFAGNDRLISLQVRVVDGDLSQDFTADENLILRANFVMTIRRIENLFVQVSEGLVDVDAVRRFRPSEDFFGNPFFREFWADLRDEMEPEFRDYFEQEFME